MNENNDDEDNASTKSTTNEKGFFFLGGFQLVSTARKIEVYVTKVGNPNEELLMTCRGIPVRDKDSNQPHDCFKVFSVVPGGPRPIKKLRLRLLSGDDGPSSPAAAGETKTPSSTKLVMIQLTGRIPDFQKQEQPNQQQQGQPIPRAQMTPSPGQMTPSSAMMMQQMLMMSGSSMGTPGSHAFSASTPLTGDSSLRNPFFSPPMSSSSDRKLPPTPMAAAGMMAPTPLAGNPPFFPGRANTPSQQSTASGSTTSANMINNTHSSANMTVNTHNSINSEAVIAGVSFLVRSEGQNTVQLVQNEIQKQQTSMDHRFQVIEQKLQHQQSMLEAVVQQQQVMLQKQYEMMTMLQHQQQVQFQWLAMSQNYSQQQQQQTAQNNYDMPKEVYCEHRQGHGMVSPTADKIINCDFPTESPYDPTCRIDLTHVEEPEDIVQLKVSDRNDCDDDDDDKPDDEDNNEKDKDDVSDKNDDADDRHSRNSSHNESDNNSNHDDDDEYTENHDCDDVSKEEDVGYDDGEESLDFSKNSQRKEFLNAKVDKETDSTQYGIYKPIETFGTTSETTFSHSQSKNPGFDEEQENDVSDEYQFLEGAIKKQLVFNSSRKGVFPSTLTMPESLLRGATKPLPRPLSDQHYATMKEDYIPFVQKSASVVDHLSIRVCNTGATEAPSLYASLSSTDMFSSYDDKDQSIEVLAVFPETPAADSTGAF